MKKNLLLFSALAAMVFTGCQSDEPAVDNGNSQDGAHYMSVKIRTAGMGGSRAATVGKPEFEEGTPQECAIAAADLRFLFFDENGNAFPLAPSDINGSVVTNMVTPTDITIQKGEGGVDEITGTLVIGTGSGAYKGQTPSQVLVVANGVEERLGPLYNKNIHTVLGTLSPAPTAWDANSKFLMTSSVYFDNNKNKIAAVNVTGNIKTDRNEAENNAVVLHIERAVAKVRATYNASYTVQQRNDAGTLENGEFTFVDVNPDGTYKEETVSFTVAINGWQLLDKAGQTAAFKQLGTYAETEAALGENIATNWVWNDANRFRSYWSNSSAGGHFQSPYDTYDLYSANAEKNKSYVAAQNNVEYCYENTGFQNAGDTQRAIHATAIAVKATLRKGAETTGIDMYRYAGLYYSKAGIEKLIKTAYISSHPTATEAELTVSFNDNAAKDNTYTATVTHNGVPTVMDRFNTILWWKNGVTSYVINIKHLNNKPGVVRNHIYDYQFTNIVGLGVPGSEPEIPELPETYLAARVYILNWHVVSNSVVLE